VLYFDLNGMKQINDRFGHPAGDAALRHFATLLLNNVRDSDVVGRLGGDEFGVILAQADIAQADEKANQLLSVIARSPLIWEGVDIQLSCAWGCTNSTASNRRRCAFPGRRLDVQGQAPALCRQERRPGS